MWKLVALAACCAVVGSQIALASEGNSTNPASPAPSIEPCTPMKKLYSRKNWRDSKPLRGENPCPNSNARKLKENFFLYRAYRRLATIRCHSGPEGYYVKPCYVIACESGFSWSAANSSGAVGPYQLLGWGAPFPVRSFRDRLTHHRIAASLSLSNWVCA